MPQVHVSLNNGSHLKKKSQRCLPDLLTVRLNFSRLVKMTIEQILYQTTVPAKITDKVKEKAYAAATRLAERMEIVGTFTVEMFVKGDEVYLNEMAPRPHNSGHYTIEACNISQFAQHVRAICGLELTPVRLFEPSIMVTIIGEDLPGTLKAIPQMTKAFVHLYG